MKIISLIDNISLDNTLKSEHGLSLYIECNNEKILFDTGSSDNILHNAVNLKIDLASLDKIIISHGHYDHIGGLKYILEINPKAQVYIKKSANNKYYSKKNNELKYIGPDLQIFKTYKNRFTFIENIFEVSENLFIIPNITKYYSYDVISKNLFKAEESTLIKDTFSHELFLIYKSCNKLNIISGCSHTGIINIIITSLTIFNDYKINLIVGGFHLKSLSPKDSYIKNLVVKLSKFSINKIYTCHCTGIEQFHVLNSLLLNNISYLYVGNTIYIN